MTPGEPRAPLVAGLVVGGGFIAFGCYTAVAHGLDLIGIGVWLAGGVALHDFLLVPLTFAIGAVVSRRAPVPLRAPLQAALIASGILILFSIPALSGKGMTADNPSRLPGDYPEAVAGLLLAVWSAAAIWTGLRVSRGRRGRA